MINFMQLYHFLLFYLISYFNKAEGIFRNREKLLFNSNVGKTKIN